MEVISIIVSSSGQAILHPALFARMDPDVNNLTALPANAPGIVPVLVNESPLKSINQKYNKSHAALQASKAATLVDCLSNSPTTQSALSRAICI